MNEYLKIINLVDNSYFKKYILTNFLIFLGSIFEIFSIALIIPLFYFLIDIENNIFLINEFFNFTIIPSTIDTKVLVFGIIILFLIVYFIKSLYLIYLFVFSKKFINDHERFLSKKVYTNYVNSDLIKSIEKDRSKTFRNVYEVNAHSSGLESSFIINQEILTFFFLFIVIALLDLKVALILGSLSTVIIIFFNFFSKRKLKFLGEMKREIESKNFTNVIDALVSQREIKILNKETYFINEFEKIKNVMLQNTFKSSLLSYYPRFIIEFFTLSAFLIYFVFSYIQIDNIKEFIPTISFVVMSAFRVLPSINRVVSNIQNLQRTSASIHNLNKENINSKKIRIYNKDKNFNFEKFIKFSGIEFSYNEKQTVLKNLNLTINKGDRIGIFGSSGSGKTTFLNLLLGLVKPTKGNVKIDNKFDLHENSTTWHKKLGFVPQRAYMQNTSVTKNIAFGVNEELIEKDKINSLIKFCKIDEFASNKEAADKIFIGDDGNKISGGQAQRIGIARGLYRDSEVLVFDEATNSLDEKNEREILVNLTNKISKNKTIIIVSHHEENLKKYCNKVYQIKNGEFEVISNNIH